MPLRRDTQGKRFKSFQTYAPSEQTGRLTVPSTHPRRTHQQSTALHRTVFERVSKTDQNRCAKTAYKFLSKLELDYARKGDFAQAYVIAHEIGHHVQNLLGTSQRVQSQQGRISKEDYNELSVRLELQADFFAGVWAHHAHRQRRILEEGDIEEGLNAANAIGDDRLQMEAQGYVIPDSFTHGSSEQRIRWFKKGLMTGDLTQGDTFNTNDL